MDKNYQRIKIVVKLVTGEEYRFITEYESVISTLWDYYIDKDWLKIYNDNGNAINFPLSKVLYWHKNILIKPEQKISDITKEIDKNIFEVNDYIPCKDFINK